MNADRNTDKDPDAPSSSELETLDIDKVFTKLDSSPAGLGNAEAENRLARYGRNELEDRQAGNLEKSCATSGSPYPS